MLAEIKPYLDELNRVVECREYIENDPVQFMYAFENKKDREIAGFLAALMAWGRRDIVCRKVEELLGLMYYQPASFIRNYSYSDLHRFSNFRHRTFKPVDISNIMLALKRIYQNYTDFESFWAECKEQAELQQTEMMSQFHNRFFMMHNEFPQRTRKHISTPEKNGSCKRMYMFLRWCIRRESPVDTGIWTFMKPPELLIPLDVHVARQSRKIGLLTRKQNDWKSVTELTSTLKILDPRDPVRYDYSLFGLGAMNYKLPRRFILNKV